MWSNLPMSGQLSGLDPCLRSLGKLFKSIIPSCRGSAIRLAWHLPQNKSKPNAHFQRHQISTSRIMRLSSINYLLSVSHLQNASVRSKSAVLTQINLMVCWHVSTGIQDMLMLRPDFSVKFVKKYQNVTC